MGLAVYFKDTNDLFTEASIDSDLTVPITTIHEGKEGDTKILQLYIRNDDAAKWFSNIIIRPVDLVDANPYGDVAYSETGWGVKLSENTSQPTSAAWEDLPWGEQIDIVDIGSDSVADITTYVPFWYLITCPPNEDVKNKDDVVLNVSYTENAVI